MFIHRPKLADKVGVRLPSEPMGGNPAAGLLYKPTRFHIRRSSYPHFGRNAVRPVGRVNLGQFLRALTSPDG